MGAVELVFVGRLSKMGGESLLLPVWSLLELGSPTKGSRMLGWLGQFTDGQETSVGWEVVLPMVSTQSTCWTDAV